MKCTSEHCWYWLPVGKGCRLDHASFMACVASSTESVMASNQPIHGGPRGSGVNAETEIVTDPRGQ